MRGVCLNGFVVLKDRVELLELLETHPALAEKLLAKRRVEHNEVLNPADDFLQLAEVFGKQQLEHHLFQPSQVQRLVFEGADDGVAVGPRLLPMAVDQ